MSHRVGIGAGTCASLLVCVLAGASSASAAFPQDGKRWRQVTETTGVTWSDVAAVCPRNGALRCSGVAAGRDLTGWIWATDTQVVTLMGHYDPAIITADLPSVSGPDHLFQ